MYKYIKIYVISLLLLALVTNCKNEESIQTYFVEHQELPNFTTIDLSPKMLDVSYLEFTEEQKETYNSLEKINFLGYRIKDDNIEGYNRELENVEKIFKNGKYDELMEFKTDGIKFRVNTEGTDQVVDEVLILASTENKGFGVVRVIGDNMKPEKMVKLIDNLKKRDVNQDQLKGIINFFK